FDNVRLYGEIKRAVGLRDEMVAVVSHDLRNPLSVIQLSADRINRALPSLPPEQREPLGVAQGAIARATHLAAQLLNDLLDFSKLRAGGFVVDEKPVSIERLLNEAREAASALCRAKAIELIVIVRDSGVVFCDAERIAQVLGNLIGNAVKFT